MTPTRIGLVVCAGALALSAAGFARADPGALDYQGPAPEPAQSTPLTTRAVATPEPPRGKWYGWTILATDAAGIAVMATGLGVRSDGFTALGFATYTFGASVVHAANDHPGAIFPSVFFRLVLPLALGLAGANSGHWQDRCHGDECTGYGFAVGWAGGMLVASAIDIGVDAYRPPAPASPAPATARVSVAPFVDPRLHGGGLQLHGAF
jgi:hypothetical protein